MGDLPLIASVVTDKKNIDIPADSLWKRLSGMSIPLLAYVAGFSVGFPVFAALFKIRSLDREMRLLLVMFSIGAVNVVLQFVVAFSGFHNLFLAHFFLLIEFLFFLWVFSCWFDRRLHIIFRTVFALFIVFWILSHVSLEKFDEPAYYTSLLSKILYTAISIVLLHRISADSTKSILQDSRFWFLSGVLIYASGGILFASLRSAIDKLPLDGLLVAYSVHWIITIVTNLLYAIGFLCKPQVQNSGGQLELVQ